MRALVTAGSRGIGAAIVTELQSRGHDVFQASRSTGYDLTQGKQRLIDEMLEWKPDIIVHNLGGTLGITDPFCSPADWLRVYQMNLGVAVALNQALVPHMQSQKWGRVVHISSVSGTENQGTVPYCTFKAALNAYTRSFGRVVAPDGVCVSAVLPGAVFTPGGYWDNPRAEAFVTNRMAIGRLGTVEEISKFVGFLCSEDASFVVGSTFLVDGGQGRAFTN